jgi:TolB protein
MRHPWHRLRWLGLLLAAAWTGCAPNQPAARSGGGRSATGPVNRLVVLDRTGNLLTLRPDGTDRLHLTRDAGEHKGYSEPAWSPDATRVAWVAAERDGEALRSAIRYRAWSGGEAGSVLTQTPPVYLAWSPNGRRLAFLAPATVNPRGRVTPTMTFNVADLTDQGGAARMAASGRPFYFDWAPDSRRVVVHFNDRRVQTLQLYRDGIPQPSPVDSGAFGTPEWLPDGREVLYATAPQTGDGGGRRGSELVTAAADHLRREPVLDYRGGISFSVRPDGRQLAYVLTMGASPMASFGPLLVRSLDDPQAKPVGVSPLPVMAFFWSPDGKQLLYVTPEPGAAQPEVRPVLWTPVQQRPELWLRWHLWDGRKSRSLGRFMASGPFFRSYLRYADQYARSVSLWSPASDAFVFAGRADSGQPGVWVQPIAADAAPKRVADGVLAAWSPR